MKKIILIGAGGHAKSCIDVILLTKKYKILGFIDQNSKINILNYKVLGDERYLKKLKNKFYYLNISLGFIKSPLKRIKIFNEFRKLNFKFPKLSHLKLILNTKILDGTIVHHNAIINFGLKLEIIILLILLL